MGRGKGMGREGAKSSTDPCDMAVNERIEFKFDFDL